MKTTFSNLFKVILLLLVASPVLVSFAFQLHQKIVQHQMKERLEKKLLQTIAVQENDIHWVKAEKEVWLNNRMFDIKSYSYNEGEYLLTGLYDDEETLLIKQLQKNQEQENKSDNKTVLQLFQLFSISLNNLTDEFVSSGFTKRQFQEKSFPLTSLCLSIITPPPQN
ncbi:MAG: hypothetical protein ABIU11_02365 [Chitinophagaceae bacterium]